MKPPLDSYGDVAWYRSLLTVFLPDNTSRDSDGNPRPGSSDGAARTAGSGLQVLFDDADRALFRTWRVNADGTRTSVLAVRPTDEPPSAASLARLSHEFSLKDELDGAWAVRPLELVRHGDRSVLVLEDLGGEPLERLLGAPLEVGRFLRLASEMAATLGRAHQRGLVHKDLKPSHVIFDEATGSVRLTGFGIAMQLPRERQLPRPPEFIAGSLAYMAPEQTGRMNRSIDARSDLYSLGVTFYQMLAGVLPFAATEPMEWVHCHIARRPLPPSERVKDIPAQLSRIVMKLLAKTAEERYQTVAGLEHDIRRCQREWETTGHIDPFPLGERDFPERLLIPEKLYGRDRETARLLGAFDRVVSGGAPELVLVSGYSGIGKSSIVNELHKELVPPRGLFASGKFDQYKRDIPYSTLGLAFQSLVRPLLGKSESELASWRDEIREALGSNGKLMADLVPELTIIVGEQPPVPELPPSQAQSRFHLVFRRFIGVFARPEHPLALFLDDLQWIDSATLDLLEDLLGHADADVRHLMLIGAYRDNEVDRLHPLMRTLQAIRRSGARVSEITLLPLASKHLRQWVADALRCAPEHAAPLAQLVQTKTDGNPFFVIQFLQALSEKGLLVVDHARGCWTWDLQRIHAARYTDNVIEFMAARLRRLPLGTQRALQELACLGHAASIATLSVVHEASQEELNQVLWEAVRLELVECQADSYEFAHDRIQEAAYSLVAEAVRPAIHLRIGRLLLAHTPEAKREEAVFEIVNQLNRAPVLIVEQDERERLAELNLVAGKRAKATAAFGSALKYLTAGAALMAGDGWGRRRDLPFALELERAECELMTGQLELADERLVALSNRVVDTVERAAVTCLRMDVCTTQDRSDRAIAVALEYLEHVGIHWSSHPSDEQARDEYRRIWSGLGSRNIGDLIDLPQMTEPEVLATVDVLTKAFPPALYTDANLASLTVCRAVNLSLEHGNCDASCFAYGLLGRIAGTGFGDFQAAYQFGRLGYELVERRAQTRFRASTYICFAVILIWAKHVGACRDLLRRAFETASRTGDMLFAAYACNNLISALLLAGDPLAEVQREAEHGLAFAQSARFGLVADIIGAQLALIRTLRGLTPRFGSLDGEYVDELRFVQRSSGNPGLETAERRYWIRKLQARYIAGDYDVAVDAFSRAQRLLSSSALSLEDAECHFYGALSLTARGATDGTEHERRHDLQAAIACHRQLAVWAENSPENFETQVALVGAEIARLEGRELDAERHYEQAIHAARANGLVHHEALASERAASFHDARGDASASQAHLRNARYCFLRWGADGKARQLEEMYSYLRTEDAALSPNGTFGTPVEQLDVETVIKISQTVSGEMDPQKLIDTLMRTAMELAGGERSLLVLSKGTEQRVEAKAATSGDTVIVEQCDEPVNASVLPETLVRFVLRTRETVILHDAAAESPFMADPYIDARQVRSVLCLPLISRAELVGALYLENNLATGVFMPARIAVLKVLALQAAIALENARLYRELAIREAKIRRLVDANIVGVLIWDADGRILEANDAFLRVVGYERADLTTGRLRWTELTPPEWLERDLQHWMPTLQCNGRAPSHEKEYIRKDGSRVPVVVGAAVFEETRNQGVGFVLDLTRLKHAEAEARENAQRHREIQAALARASRVTAMGQLAAMISHEANQPIAAVAVNAEAGLRWLSAEPPKLDEARQAFEIVIGGAARASDVIDRICGLVMNQPSRKESLQMNEVIQEVVVLMVGEAKKCGVSVSMDLADDLPLVVGDRVQLQQVILNLMINALEAMSTNDEESRDLNISTRKCQWGSAAVKVCDSGPGIVIEKMGHIFEPFVTTKPTGTGIGLSICRTIVQAHGGQLRVSANMPRGAVFEFTVPALSEPAPVIAHRP